MADLTIGKVAAGAGVNVETVRYYQRVGLIARCEASGEMLACPIIASLSR